MLVGGCKPGYGIYISALRAVRVTHTLLLLGPLATGLPSHYHEEVKCTHGQRNNTITDTVPYV